MNFTKTMFALAIGSVGIMGAMGAHAVALNNGDTLTITAGVPVGTTDPDTGEFDQTNVSTGSWFAMDSNNNSKIAGYEKVALSMGTAGIVIGVANTTWGQITAPWSFISSLGSDFVTTAISGGTAGLDMSGWMLNWGGDIINMGAGGAWNPLNAASSYTFTYGTPPKTYTNASAGMATSSFTDSMANFIWDGVYGSTYTLDYTATVQTGGFTGVQYALHLTGVVAVPEASTYGMMLAGLGLVGAMAGRRKIAII